MNVNDRIFCVTDDNQIVVYNIKHIKMMILLKNYHQCQLYKNIKVKMFALVKAYYIKVKIAETIVNEWKTDKTTISDI